jgi:hypothetical protein
MNSPEYIAGVFAPIPNPIPNLVVNTTVDDFASPIPRITRQGPTDSRGRGSPGLR